MANSPVTGSTEGQISPQRRGTSRSSLLDLCHEMQVTTLQFLLQPAELSENLVRSRLPFSESIIPYHVPDSPFSVSREGILQVNRHFRTLGLRILFQNRAYTPVCLCVRWFDQLKYLSLYGHVGYRACSYKHQILLSPSESTLELPFLGISEWTRLVLPMKISRSTTKAELRTISLLLAKMVNLKSLHLILKLSPDRNGSDWEVLFQELNKLRFLDHISFTIHCLFTTSVFDPVVSCSSVQFERRNLSKGEGLRHLKSILNHTCKVHRQIRTVRNGVIRRTAVRVVFASFGTNFLRAKSLDPAPVALA
jgi:hypothetical protein